MSQAEVKLDLSRIVFIGRTFDEYMSMFNLTKEELINRKILDCPAGACSFTATANQVGADVTATDIAYYHPFEQLAEKGFEDIEHAMLNLEKAKSNYVWDYFKSVAGLRNHRMQALHDCAKDMKQFPNRYIPAVLPVLPFKDKEYDLTLSAHFLFMYADRLDYDFHLQSIQELMRVTKEKYAFSLWLTFHVIDMNIWINSLVIFKVKVLPQKKSRFLMSFKKMPILC